MNKFNFDREHVEILGDNLLDSLQDYALNESEEYYAGVDPSEEEDVKDYSDVRNAIDEVVDSSMEAMLRPFSVVPGHRGYFNEILGYNKVDFSYERKIKRLENELDQRLTRFAEVLLGHATGEEVDLSPPSEKLEGMELENGMLYTRIIDGSFDKGTVVMKLQGHRNYIDHTGQLGDCVRENLRVATKEEINDFFSQLTEAGERKIFSEFVHNFARDFRR